MSARSRSRSVQASAVRIGCVSILVGAILSAQWLSPRRLGAADFTLDPASPSWPTSSDVLADRPGPVAALPRLAIPAAAMGLMAQDVIDALSDGRDPIDPQAHPGTRKMIFSVTRLSAGLAGTGVAQEKAMDTAPPAGGNPNGHASDLFVWEGVAGMNALAPAPIGWSLGSQTGDEANAHLVLPGAGQPGDNVIAYDRRTMRCMGAAGGACQLNTLVFFSLRAGSPTLGMIGATAGDVLVVGGPLGNVPVVFVTGAALGLPAQADLDALSLEVRKTAAGQLVPHRVRFSVDSASAGFALPGGMVVNSGADVLLFDGAATTIEESANDLGLAVADDVDALESLVTVAAPGGAIIIDPVGDARVTPSPGGHDFVVEVAPAPGAEGAEGVELSFPPALGVTHDLDFEAWANSRGLLSMDMNILLSPNHPARDSDGVPVRVLELERNGDRLRINPASFPTDVAGIPVNRYELATRNGGEVVSDFVIMPNPGIIAILIGLFSDKGPIDHLSVSTRLRHRPADGGNGAALVLSTSIDFGSEIELKLGDKRTRGDRLEISSFMDYTDDAFVSMTGEDVTISGLDGQDTLGGFEIRGFDIRRGIIHRRAAHEALGNARVGEGAGGGVEVSGMGASGEDGVGVDVDSFTSDGSGLDEMTWSFASGPFENGSHAGEAPRKLRVRSHSDGTSNTLEASTAYFLMETAPGVLAAGIEGDSAGTPIDLRVEAFENGVSNGALDLGASDRLSFVGGGRLSALGIANGRLTLQFAVELMFDTLQGTLRGTEFRLSNRTAGNDRLRRVELTGENVDSLTISDVEMTRRGGFRRGDTNNDGSLGLVDAIVTLNAMFVGVGRITCDDAADANDDGRVTIADPILTLTYLFIGKATIPAPGAECGADPTADGLECAAYSGCE